MVPGLAGKVGVWKSTELRSDLIQLIFEIITLDADLQRDCEAPRTETKRL